VVVARLDQTGEGGEGPLRFYVGLHHPSVAGRFERCMVSINALMKRKSDFPAREWMLDSGAFTAVTKHGDHVLGVEDYAERVKRWARCGWLVAAVSQDYMCEPFVLKRTGMSVADHQRLTVERYAALSALVPREVTHLMPVIQGYWPDEYIDHIRQYGRLLRPGAWVGVGSVCKRNAKVESVEAVLMAIRKYRVDLQLHGFGLKTTALASSIVRECLYSADSMAWSFAARREGRDGNSPAEAAAFVERIESQEVRRRQWQPGLWD
jgi:hypothetical protein